MKIEDYAMIGDLHTAALVDRAGSIDWLCLPRFDSGACLASLLGGEENGRWRLAPTDAGFRTSRAYRDDTLILETEFTTGAGRARLVDFMPVPAIGRHLVRIVEGLEGRVELRTSLTLRFDNGLTVPWVRQLSEGGGVSAVAGPNGVVLRTPVPLRGEQLSTVGVFTVEAGQRVAFALSWFPSHEQPPSPVEPEALLEATEAFWREWAGRCTYQGPWRPAVLRALLTVKGLTYALTGGIVAAATTSLPEFIGGVRNWDYRFCWLRDATFTLYSLMKAGYTGEAEAWGRWLLRSVAGAADELQIMYGVAGERLLPESVVPHLRGYEGSRPVRTGNAASEQFQLDVYGEVLDAMHVMRTMGLGTDPDSWHLQRHLLEFVIAHWREPDEGLWEIRGPRQHFVHSKVMAWVALDRGIKAIEHFGLDGDREAWVAVRAAIHEDVCRRGYHQGREAFTQAYGSDELDAAVLMMPLVGFLPIDDPRVSGTLELIRTELTFDGLVRRYETHSEVDGLPPGEGVFLACSFWLADCLQLAGRRAEAVELFEHLLCLRNDVGLLAEEYDPEAGRQLGNFPQAFSLVGLINTAHNLSPRQRGPAQLRSTNHGLPPAGRETP